MLPESDVLTQLLELRSKYDALVIGHEALRGEKSEQELAAQAWIRQRNEELEIEAIEQKKAATLQRVFYQIAERSTAGLSFYDFLQTVHALLAELLTFS
jgi:hypothetical protein